MLIKAIPDIFHARLHKRNKDLRFYAPKTSAQDFRDNNRDILNEIALSLQKDFGIVFTYHEKEAMELGLRNYLQAEGVLK